jgi:hypothetical protein
MILMMMMMMQQALMRDSTFHSFNFSVFLPEVPKVITVYIVERIDLCESLPHWTFPATHYRERVCLHNRKDSDCVEAT